MRKQHPPPKDQLRRGSGRAPSRAVSAKDTGVLPDSALRAPPRRRGPAVCALPGAGPTFGQQARGVHEGRVQAVSLCHQLRQVLLLFHSADFVRPPARLRAPCAGRTSPPSCSPATRPPQPTAGVWRPLRAGAARPPRAEAVPSLPAGRAAVPHSHPGLLSPAACTGRRAQGASRPCPALFGGCASRGGALESPLGRIARRSAGLAGGGAAGRRAREVRALSSRSRRPQAVRRAQLWSPGVRSCLSSAEARAEKSGKGAVTEKPESETAGRRGEAARSDDARAPGAPQESRGDSTASGCSGVPSPACTRARCAEIGCAPALEIQRKLLVMGGCCFPWA